MSIMRDECSECGGPTVPGEDGTRLCPTCGLLQ